MDHITIENIEKEMERILENCPMTRENLKMLVLLGGARKCISKIHNGFTQEDAAEWVKHMNPPARWTMEQTKAAMAQRGYNHDPHEFYAVMNALASDYGKTMAKYGVDKPEIWAELAHDFIKDADTVEDKVGVYFAEIVEH